MSFDGEKWTVEWNKVDSYETHLKEERANFDIEIDCWIKKGILALWDKDVRMGVLPLMAVVQPTKNKVQPVLDYQELNKYICHSGGDAID